MSIIRYTDGGFEGWMQSPTGEFVTYEDYAKLKAKYLNLKSMINTIYGEVGCIRLIMKGDEV